MVDRGQVKSLQTSQEEAMVTKPEGGKEIDKMDWLQKYLERDLECSSFSFVHA